MQNNCECNRSFYIDSMCKPCLERVRKSALEKIEQLEEEILDIDAVLDEINFYLYDEDDEGEE